MVPVFHCLSTLKASFDYAAGGENNENHTRKRWDFSETGSLEDIDFSQGDVSTCGQLPGHCPVISGMITVFLSYLGKILVKLVRNLLAECTVTII